MNQTLTDLLHLFQQKGSQQYGQEAVTQLEHALQCATLAETANATPELITACLFHDLGHLVHDLGENIATQGIDDRHEYRAIPILKSLFNQAVTEPIRLHVAAKRYLCATDNQYWNSLSPASRLSLELQGGIFSADEATLFIRQSYGKDAVKLRIWDDLAKQPHKKTPDLNHFFPMIQHCLIH
jgi:phosphonate degradation associated HDIG domain protein